MARTDGCTVEKWTRITCSPTSALLRVSGHLLLLYGLYKGQKKKRRERIPPPRIHTPRSPLWKSATASHEVQKKRRPKGRTNKWAQRCVAKKSEDMWWRRKYEYMPMVLPWGGGGFATHNSSIIYERRAVLFLLAVLYYLKTAFFTYLNWTHSKACEYIK